MPTLGESRVRLAFNPTHDTLVDDLKLKTAALIDLCDQHKTPGTSEANRLWALAQTYYETAAMWAVKAATANHK